MGTYFYISEKSKLINFIFYTSTLTYVLNLGYLFIYKMKISFFSVYIFTLLMDGDIYHKIY